MPSAARIAAQIARHGRAVTLRFAPASVGGTWTEVAVIAHLAGASAQPVVDGASVQQGDREMRVAQAALTAASAPRALRDGDQVVADGQTFMIMSADPRALRGASALVVLHLRGG